MSFLCFSTLCEKGMLQGVYQEASEVEMTEHLGYKKHNKSENTNYRNGYNQKTLLSNEVVALAMTLYEKK